MTKQKKGFWVFICSLVPGAGELYMGFRKQGLSIMVTFWGIITVAACLNFGFLTALLPIVWCYSFFNVHNLKSLTEDEFYSLEDDYAVHIEKLIGDRHEFFEKYRVYISIGIICFGLLALWNCIPIFFGGLIPEPLASMIRYIVDIVPRVAVAFAIIGIGIYLITSRNKKVHESEYDRLEDKNF